MHSFDIDSNLYLYSQVPYKFRFPFYAHLHWYAVKRYIDLLEKDLEEKEESEKMENGNKDDQQDKPPIKLTIRKVSCVSPNNPLILKTRFFRHA